MKLWQLADDIFLKHGNLKCELEVETDDIKELYGYEYDGGLIPFGGISGLLSNIPVYLGYLDVKKYALIFENDETRLEVTI